MIARTRSPDSITRGDPELGCVTDCNRSRDAALMNDVATVRPAQYERHKYSLSMGRKRASEGSKSGPMRSGIAAKREPMVTAGPGPTDFLRILSAPGRYVLLLDAEGSQRSVALIKNAAGNNLHEVGGYKVRPVELPTDILNDFLEERFVISEGNDPNGSAIYRISPDGKTVAKNAGGVL